MTEYIANLLADSYKTAILSRGYKRATKGFVLADENATVGSLGDEPFQYHCKLPKVTVAVDEDRRHGIEQLHTGHGVEVILLDDGFQHRRVQAGFNVLLTMYGDLFVDDLLLPAGNLRDTKSQAKRADIVVVTKCPSDLSPAQMAEIASRLKLSANQQLFFSSIEYHKNVIGHHQTKALSELKSHHITLVTGIAKPEPLVDYLNAQKLSFTHRKYPDHHNFNANELAELKGCDLILTTEKDYTRLSGHLKQLYYLPIGVKILKQEKVFNKTILRAVEA
jgi:tetraacyldisaccharide 4'-kinase